MLQGFFGKSDLERRLQAARRDHYESQAETLRPILAEFEKELSVSVHETAKKCRELRINGELLAGMMIMDLAEMIHNLRKILDKRQTDVERLDLGIINMIRLGKPEF